MGKNIVIKHPVQGFVINIINRKVTFCSEYPDARLFTSVNKAKDILKTIIPGISGSFGLTKKEIDECVVVEDYGMDTEKVH